jgi:hypothetical protein
MGRWNLLKLNLEIAADRLAWWLKSKKIAGNGSPNTTRWMDEKINETRLELAMLNRSMMRMRAAR